MPDLNKTNSNYKGQPSGSLELLSSIIALISLLFGINYLFGGGGIAGALPVALAIGVFYSLGGRRMGPILLPRDSSG